MYNVALQADRLIAGIDAMPAIVRALLETKVSALAVRLQALVIRKLSGDLLQVRSGRLRRSIQEVVETTDTSVTGRVFSAGDVKYAGIQERGGVTGPHDIYPDKAKVLAFVMGGRQVFASVVHHPGSHIPAHHFMSGSLEEMAGEIVAEMKSAVVEGAKQAIAA